MLEVGLTSPVPAADLYEVEDWSSVPAVSPTESGRLYACRCTVHRELRTTLMNDPDFDPLDGDVKLPWRCAGHPVCKPPIAIDGLTLTASEDFVDLLAAVARGEVPEGAHQTQRVSPVQWLYRLRNRLRGSVLAARFEEAMAESLASEDDRSVAQALLYFDVIPDSSGFPTALKAMKRVQRRPYLDHQGKPRQAFSTLLSRVSQAGGVPDETDGQVVQLVKMLAVDAETPLNSRHVRNLAFLDPVWLADNAPAIAAGRPGLAADLLGSLFVVDRQDLIVVAGTRIAHDGDEAAKAEVHGWASDGYHVGRAYALVLLQALAGGEA